MSTTWQQVANWLDSQAPSTIRLLLGSSLYRLEMEERSVRPPNPKTKKAALALELRSKALEHDSTGLSRSIFHLKAGGTHASPSLSA